MAWASVCLAHCCIVSKRCKLGSPNLHCGCPKDSSFFRDEIWRRWVKGFPSNEGVEEGYPSKNVILRLLTRLLWKRLQIGTDMLLIVTSTGHGVFSFININDLERPWTRKKWVFDEWIFCNFWLQHTFQEWIAMKWLEINQDNLRTKFSA